VIVDLIMPEIVASKYAAASRRASSHSMAVHQVDLLRDKEDMTQGWERPARMNFVGKSSDMLSLKARIRPRRRRCFA